MRFTQRSVQSGDKLTESWRQDNEIASRSIGFIICMWNSSWDKHSCLCGDIHFSIFKFEGKRSFQDVPNFEADDIADDVDWMLRRLAKAGMAQALVVDLTIAKYGLPVVRVVVPGLEGPDKGPASDYVPGARARAMKVARP